MNEQSQMMKQSKVMKQKQKQNQNQQQPIPMMSQPPPQMMSQPPPQQMMSQPMPMMNRSYGMWPQPPPPPMNQQPMDPMMFQNPYGGPGRSNWKGKKGMDNMQKDLSLINRRNEIGLNTVNSVNLGGGGGGGYQPPTLLELQSQNRNKAKKYYHPKKKFNNRSAPYAPRNTSSFIIRAKKSGGIASLVSPCPVTPAVLPTPVFSPSREVLGDIAKEEWGVDGYGSMKGLIRLRSPGNDPDGEDDEDDDGSSESDVEEHVEVERRLDHDLSRFEMIYPNGAGCDYNTLLENRVDDQDTHIAQLEEENLTLKERLFLMEREMGDMRRRLQSLERLARVPGDANEEVVENGSDNDAESSGRGEGRPLCIDYNEEMEYVDERGSDNGRKEDLRAVTELEGMQEASLKDVQGNLGAASEITNIEPDVGENGKTVEEDVNMEESEVAPLGERAAEQGMREAKLKDESSKETVEPVKNVETSEEKVTDDTNIEDFNVGWVEKVPENHAV